MSRQEKRFRLVIGALIVAIFACVWGNALTGATTVPEALAFTALLVGTPIVGTILALWIES